jgi:hypothetical protein
LNELLVKKTIEEGHGKCCQHFLNISSLVGKPRVKLTTYIAAAVKGEYIRELDAEIQKKIWKAVGDACPHRRNKVLV